MKLVGFDGLEKALDDLPKATSKNVVRRVLKKHGQPFADTARQLVPVDQGHLKRGITVGTRLAKSQRREAKKLQQQGFILMHVGPKGDPAAHITEFGFDDRAAEPFMRPAWDKHKGGVLDGIADDLWKEIKKASERLARKAAKAALKG